MTTSLSRSDIASSAMAALIPQSQSPKKPHPLDPPSHRGRSPRQSPKRLEGPN
jgi:hypothetical protein